ncbi:MAG: type I glutamate--ammonia ligase [Gammaproteobacteria bacterium]|nr:type I glutamate--ammonia ligase [Gammaproteobacteria bacterium]
MSDILNMLKEQDVKFVDLRFTDTIGKELHVTVPAHKFDESFLAEGKMFDGSSIAGWKSIHASDMVLMPDVRTAVMDPFYQEPTLLVRCDILEPETMSGYERDPRNIAHRAESYLQSTGIADCANFGPEPEFFIFDSVLWDLNINGSSYSVDSKEGIWNSGTHYENGNLGHRPRLKGGYFPVPPTDSSQNIRAAMSLIIEKLGLEVETHHHEVATGNQNEISTLFRTMRRKGDEIQLLKYAVHNVAHSYGKTATFMPKLLVGDNGNGMHCHQSLEKDGVNLFTGDSYAGLSDIALYYIGGILKHACAINAFANATTNSYRRLMPGFEAPVSLAYSSCNRSAAIRIPHSVNPKARRIEVRFPDPCCNPYLAFSAMLMAGLDGIQNKIEPGEAIDKDLYDLSVEEAATIPTICSSLEEALDALNADREFLKKGGVFTDDLLDAYIELKQEETRRVRLNVHPMEVELYYSL